MHAARRSTAIALVMIAGAQVGCAGDADRPPPAGDPSTLPPDEVSADELIVYTRRGVDPCPPGTWRECRVYFVDDRGQQQCPLDVQYCRANGNGWLPCGERPTNKGAR